jgi:hypothetical protein
VNAPRARRADGVPVVAVTGMAFEAKIVRGRGVDVVFAARSDWLERALSDAVARGCSGIISFGTAGGLAPDLEPGALIVAQSVCGPFGTLPTDDAWSARIVEAFAGTPLARITRRGPMAGVTAPVKSEADKRSLHSSTGALAVDMESHIAGAIATARCRSPYAARSSIPHGARCRPPRPRACATMAPRPSARFFANSRASLRSWARCSSSRAMRVPPARRSCWRGRQWRQQGRFPSPRALHSAG